MKVQNKEIEKFFENLKSITKFEFPKYETPSIPQDGLIEEKKEKIEFKNGEYYDTTSKKIYLNNGEVFEGEINEGKKYSLIDGIYHWLTKQKFKGKFLNNDEYEGSLTYEDGFTYNGKLNNFNFEGKGEFRWNSEEYINGTFKKGKINGEAIIQKDNYYINGNFNNSIIDGKINELNIKLNNHLYKFRPFNYKNEKIMEKKIILDKDGSEATLDNKTYKKIDIDNNKNKINLSKDELTQLNKFFDLFDELIPKIEIPSISKEELINTKKGDYSNIIFTNGAKAILDDENDQQVLVLENGEKFEGLLNDDNDEKYWLEKGKYIWPSGQEYIGEFNENNEFESNDAELKMPNLWTYKGEFEKGKLKGHGKFEWEGGNNYIDAYFSNGNIYGNTTIKLGDLTIKGFLINSSINEIEATFDNHTYKIEKIDKNINEEELLLIEKDENDYSIVQYSINNNKIKIEKSDKLLQDEKESLLNCIKSINDIFIPNYQPFSIPKDGLIIKNDIIIKFENGIIYNIETKKLEITNKKETYKGELFHNELNIYFLKEGEYKWNSGQKYIGKFKNNEFDGDSTLISENNWSYIGNFKNGTPNGKGELKYDSGDIISGNFESGKIIGIANIQKNYINFEVNYTNSIMNGTINNIRLKNGNWEISNININDGIINDDYIISKADKVNEKDIEKDIEDNKKDNREDNENINDKDKKNDKDNGNNNDNKIKNKIPVNENDIILLFKALSKIRKINLCFSSVSIPENGLILNDKNINNMNDIKLTFQNNETFHGKIEKNNGKYWLIEGEYEWPSGQKYIGKFNNNKFDSETADLKCNNKWEYRGGFKNGYIDGNGTYENNVGELIIGYFEKGEIKKNIIIKTKNIYFEGEFNNSINDLNIKIFSYRIKEHYYNILKFKMNDKTIKLKIDDVLLEVDISPELHLKIIESLLVKTKVNKQKFFFNEPYKRQASNENKLKFLKIQDNIQSKQLSKLSIYHNRLSQENRNVKGEIGKIIGVNLDEEISYDDLMIRLNARAHISQNDKKNLINKFKNFQENREILKKNKYKEIEQKEILKIYSNKMLKGMEEEIYLINQDINTLRKEREIIEKEKSNKISELMDLNQYYDLINENSNKIKNEKIKIEEDTKEIEKNLNNKNEENNYLLKYLDNIKNNGLKNIKIGKNKKIKDLENENNKLLKEIKEKDEIINKENKEIEELMKKKQEFLEKIENQKKIKK